MALPLPRELGEILTATVLTPAPGVHFAHAIPNTEVWRLLACDLTFTVALGTRTLNIGVENAALINIWGTSEATAFPVGGTAISWGIGLTDSAAIINARFAKQLPNCFIAGPATIISLGTLGVTDTLTFIQIMYQRWRLA